MSSKAVDRFFRLLMWAFASEFTSQYGSTPPKLTTVTPGKDHETKGADMTPDEFNAKYPVGSEFTNKKWLATIKFTTVTSAYRDGVGVPCVVVRHLNGGTHQVRTGALAPVSPPREPNGVRIVFKDGTAREEFAEEVNPCSGFGIRWNTYKKGGGCVISKGVTKFIVSIAPCYIEPEKKPEPQDKVCEECHGHGELECPHCGKEMACDFCNGIGYTVCQ